MFHRASVPRGSTGSCHRGAHRLRLYNWHPRTQAIALHHHSHLKAFYAPSNGRNVVVRAACGGRGERARTAARVQVAGERGGPGRCGRWAVTEESEHTAGRNGTGGCAVAGACSLLCLSSTPLPPSSSGRPPAGPPALHACPLAAATAQAGRHGVLVLLSSYAPRTHSQWSGSSELQDVIKPPLMTTFLLVLEVSLSEGKHIYIRWSILDACALISCRWITYKRKRS